MVGVSSQAAKMSALTIDDDLNMGAYAIIINAGGLIDETDISELKNPGATDMSAAIVGSTGDMSSPTRVADGSVATAAYADAIDEYAEIDFGRELRLDQYHLWGDASNNQTGRWKIQHWDGSAWVDNTTAIVANAGSWTDWTALTTPITTSKVRIICTTVDNAINMSKIAELEFRGT
jgi:hypothetical protein